MIDNIRITLNIPNYTFPDTPLIEKESEKVAYLLNSFLNKDEELHKLRLVNNNELTISNSVRKWALGHNSIEDLNIESFKNTIFKIAEILKIDKDIFLNAEVRMFEIGKNLKLPIGINIVYDNIYTVKVKKKWYVTNSSISLFSENFDIKLYDKYEDILEKRIIGKRKIANRIKKLRKENYLLRYELKINRPKKIIKTKDKFTLQDLFNNYIFFVKKWRREAFKIQFDTCLNYKIDTYYKFNAYIRGLGFEKMGMRNVLKQLDALQDISPVRKSYIRKYIVKEHKFAIKHNEVKKSFIIEVLKEAKKEIS